jgi:hypothetical protein
MKLCVTGCSFSDYTQVDEVYGEVCARHLGAEYLHLAGGAGSNARMVRLIVQSVLSGELQSGDLVIAQYTQPERRELHSPGLRHTEKGIEYRTKIDAQKAQDHRTNPHYDYSVTGGIYTRWKPHSHQWQGCEQDTDLHQMVEQHGVDYDCALEETRNLHIFLKLFLREHGIKLSVFWFNLGWEAITYWKDRGYDMESETDIHFNTLWQPGARWHDEAFSHYRLSPGDNSHLSAQGHTEMGFALSKFLKLLYTDLTR